FLERNKLIHPPTADQITLTISSKSHSDGVFENLALAPDFDLIEMSGPLRHHLADIGRNTISGVKKGLWTHQYLCLANNFCLSRKKSLPPHPALTRNLRIRDHPLRPAANHRV